MPWHDSEREGPSPRAEVLSPECTLSHMLDLQNNKYLGLNARDSDLIHQEFLMESPFDSNVQLDLDPSL